jgi:hypothetical protein
LKLLRKKSGQFYTVEAIIAIVLIVGFSLFIAGVYRVNSSRVSVLAGLRQTGEDTLGVLDQSGQLASWVCVDPPNMTGLDRVLSQILPSRVGYNVYVLDVDLNQIGSAFAGHGNSTDLNTVVVLYLVSGYEGHYEPRVVKLELWFEGG